MAILKQQTEANREDKMKITVGLDIGTSKICALVAAPDEQTGHLNILGIGIAESEGLNRGVVTNIDKTVKTIKSVIDQAEQQSGVKIEEAVVGIAGDHIESFQSKGIIGISNPNSEVNQNDVDRLLEESRNIKIPSDRKILHVIPQEFIIDGQDGIIDPVGMSGVRMEANVHIVTGLLTAIQNLNKVIERNNIKVKDVVLEPLASSHAVLAEDEKEVGVALIDIGGGTTDIAIFENNIIRFTSVFGIAGKQVTDDIRKGLGIVAKNAEKIKKEFGHAHIQSIRDDVEFMIPSPGGKRPMEIRKRDLAMIIQPRFEEIFEFALAEIRRSGYSGSLGAGIVLTGGCSLIDGVEELAQEIFGTPVRIGIPSGISYSGLAPEIENPMYSTAVGLALYGLDLNMKGSVISIKEKDQEESMENQEHKTDKQDKNIIKKVTNFLKEL